jgi:two-component system LytT family response regulator
MKILVIEDDPTVGQFVKRGLEEARWQVELVADGEQGEQRALRDEFDLVILDMRLPGRTGLEVLREIGPDAMPATILVTAYDQHALAAFELAAVDYLLKPFDDERFEQAFRRARRLIAFEEIGRLRDRLLAVLEHAGAGPPPRPARDGYLERIPVTTGGETRVVPVAEIDYITASGPYARLHAGGGQRYVIREAMQVLEESLDPARFMRIHRSVIVRVELVESLRRGAGGEYRVQLRGGVRLRVSRSRREALERRLGIS